MTTVYSVLENDNFKMYGVDQLWNDPVGFFNLKSWSVGSFFVEEELKMSHTMRSIPVRWLLMRSLLM